MSFTDVLLAGMMIIVPAVSNLPENKTAAKECLAVNMYHEARDQGTAGRLAVSAVVLNRVRDSRFPNTVCEVVYQAQMKLKAKQNPKKMDNKIEHKLDDYFKKMLEKQIQKLVTDGKFSISKVETKFNDKGEKLEINTYVKVKTNKARL